MCGVVAIVGDGDAHARLGDAVAALRHRGPDGDGAWRSDDRRVSLGHTRLAVVAPADGAQPVRSEDGAIVAVVNGELYDPRAVARSLVARGHRLRGDGDAELLVHLYEDDGVDALRALRGELAFALWDGRRRRLVAARDRFGIKPLVWARCGDAVVLASEAKALFAAGVPARWDDEAWFHAAHTQYPWPDRTLFDGVRQVEPGGTLVVELGATGAAPTVTVGRWWHDAAPPELVDRAAAVAAVRAALDDAVRTRTVADAAIAVQLSGGVDSSAVAALAARHRGDVRAFTIGFPAEGVGEGDDAGYDERAIAAATARAIGVPLVEVNAPAAALADAWPRAVAHGEGLAINGHIAAKWLLSRAMRDAGVKVALTGEGADELFLGYPHLRVDAGATIAGHAASRGVMLPHGDGLALDGVRARLGFVPTWLAAKASLGARVRRLLAPDLVARHAGDDPYLALVERTAPPAALPPARQSAHAWIRAALAQYILRTLGDGMELAHGIEGRVPFLDPGVADVAQRLPAAWLVDGVSGAPDKVVLREAVADVVPAAVRARPKHPLLAPPLATAAPALLQDLLRTHADRSPRVDRAAVRAVADALPTMPPDERRAWDPALMLVASAAVLEARYAR